MHPSWAADSYSRLHDFERGYLGVDTWFYALQCCLEVPSLNAGAQQV